MDFNISLIKLFIVMQIFERRENCLIVFVKKIIFRVLIMNFIIYVYFFIDDM